jgi:AraC-like DNA-binding protein
LSNDLTKRAERLALDGRGIAVICRTLNISERTLRKAFHRKHGVPPCRRFRMLRLAGARGALLLGHGTVTAIAMDFGFEQLGRFAGEYRKAFGESPSQTLKRIDDA